MASSLVASAIQWIGSLLVQEAKMLLEVEDQVRSLQEELALMQQYLQDADAKQEMMEIHTLVKQIRKLSFEVEDIIDTYILEVETKRNGVINKGRLMKFVCFLNSVPQTYSIGKQIQLMQSNVKRITDRLIEYGVRRVMKVKEDHETYSKQRPRSYPYDDEGDYIVGLEKDIRSLIEVLMGEGKTQVRLVSIVGMGGSGKTTLARKLFNHPYTKECFDCCAWVYISQEWSTSHVLLEIIRKVSSPMEISQFNVKSSVEELVDKLRSILEKKSYLVVLDDVWRKEALEQILPALPWPNNNKGSKIIITTRNQEVIQYQNLQRHLYTHESRPLTEEESWELFCKIAFNNYTNCINESFEALGKEMLKKCDGLPLAIVALAGILNDKRSIREWQLVSEAVRLRVMEGTCTHMYGRVGEMLSLSYDDLPCYLKPCFLYLGLFPEDCQIPAGMLTRMWIAEGLVIANEEMSAEDVAMQRLTELRFRFMIQVVNTNFRGAIKAIHMHDLLHDLCVRKAKEQSFLEIYTPMNRLVPYDASTISSQSRRAALHSSTSLPVQVSNLRSLVVLTKSSIMHSAYAFKESFDVGIVRNNFKLLRLVNLWGIKTPTGTLPAQIGSLIHLRYLGIRASNITELPDSIGKLRNLFTLDYRNIDSDVDVIIPNVLWKLTLLRHLFLPTKCPWLVENLELSPLKNLQILWGVQSTGGDWFSREMFDLSTTLKKLKVIVSTNKDLEAAFSCRSLMCDGLHTFHCEWSNGIALRENHIFSHNQHLHKLVMVGKIRVEKLIWPSNLLVLVLKDSVIKDEDPLMIAGKLRHLKLLRLANSYTGTAFVSCLGSFRQLEELYIENLRNLETWSIENGAMPTLRKLEVLSCRKLHFPQGLVYVTSLQQFEFLLVSEEFAEQAKVFGWSQERLRLPHNFDAIISRCDIAFDVSSAHKLSEKLTTGVFLDKKKKMFWVMKLDNHQYNCFMVYATDLSFAIEHDIDGFPRWISGNDIGELDSSLPLWDANFILWTWMEIEERNGALIKVAKLMSEVHVLEVRGSFDISYLSPSVAYTFSFVIMLDDSKWKEEVYTKTKLVLPRLITQEYIKRELGLPGHKSPEYIETEFALPGHISQEQRQTWIDKPRNEWIKVPVGELEAHRNVIIGDVAEFFLQCRWRLRTKLGFFIKGVIIEPKI